MFAEAEATPGAGRGPRGRYPRGMVDRNAPLQILDRAGVRDGRVLVAVSGGRDSMWLLAWLDALRAERGLDLVVGHVDHGLRGAASAADAAFVAEQARARGLACLTRAVDPAGRRTRAVNSSTRPTLEEAARDLRRAALEEMARDAGAAWIALAHHAGDQAETVLLRILRGTAPDGLAAMAPISADGRIVRPLLGTLPETIEKAARDQGLVWREDASNRDRRFARNRLRHDWLPGLAEAFQPNLLRNLVHLADAQRTDLEWIEGLVAAEAEERIEGGADGLRLAIDGWAALPDALARRLVRVALVEAGLGRALSAVHIDRVLAFLRRGRRAGRDLRIELPLGAKLARRDDHFRLVGPAHRDESAPRGDATVPRRD